MKIENYFDNAATTPVDPRVIREMLPYFETNWGNANSLHFWGRAALAAVDHARERVAALLDADDPSEIFFTSGATESNNWIFQSLVKPEINERWISAISPFEHNAVLEPALRAGARLLKNKGLVLEIASTEEEFFLLSVMAVNNEIGTIFDPWGFEDASEIMHSDITQAVGKLRIKQEPLDYASFSAHKFYGPKGVGGLFAQVGPHSRIKPMILGGEHESGFRAGTLNVPGIVGMGVAAAIAQDEMDANLSLAKDLRAAVLEQIRPCQDYQVNGGDNVSPYILSLSFLGVEGETLVIEMDQKGFGISSGAACSTGSTDPSHVLTALGMPIEWIRGTVRVSFGRFNTLSAAEQLGKSLRAAVESLRKLRTV